MKKQLVGINERGQRVGEDHPMAKLSNHDVDLIRELAEERDANGRRRWGRRRLAQKFDCSPWTIQSIIENRFRMQPACAFKAVEARRRKS